MTDTKLQVQQLMEARVTLRTLVECVRKGTEEGDESVEYWEAYKLLEEFRAIVRDEEA